jgi:PAS domain S-box-containing protein
MLGPGQLFLIRTMAAAMLAAMLASLTSPDVHFSGNRRGHALALLVLLASLLVVGIYWRTARNRELAVAEANFIVDCKESVGLLVQQLSAYELVARGGVSLFATVERPSRRQWQDYVDGLDIGHRFPAIAGLGFAVYASPGQLAELQRQIHDNGEGLYSVRPEGPRGHYGPILYLEPKTQANLDAIGYDMYTEPVRHAAMEAALDSGGEHLSGGVHLVQDASSAEHGRPIAALLLFQPVYHLGGRDGSLSLRHESMRGWVYIPFHVEQFVVVALSATLQHPRLRIIDVTDAQANTLYVSPSTDAREPAFVHSEPMERYGRRWRLDFISDPLEAIDERTAGLLTTLAIGVFASMLLFGITLTLVRTQGRAEYLAARMSDSYRRSELRFRGAMEHSAIGMALLDHEGSIVEANPALVAILGNTADLRGTSFDDRFVEESLDHSHDRERDLAIGVTRMTRTLLRADGVRLVHLTSAPLPGDDDVHGIARLVQVEDVTDRVRAEAQVLALNRTLEARVAMRTRELTLVNQELETFAYSVSHDLRAPLRSIDGFSKLLADRYSDAIDQTGHDYLARVRSAARRMGELIEALLSMSSVGRGGMTPVTLDLGPIAEEVIGDLRDQDPDREVTIIIQGGLHAVADQGLVRSLLQNLLGNAWKFTRDTVAAKIEIGRNADNEFFVRDNGAGFAQEYAGKLFRPFQRLHHAAQFNGHGIGLASVKRIVERHGGMIRAEGKPGQGATFYFTLPEVETDSGS